MKPEKRAEARRLRREQGLALGAIAQRLGVSKGSVSLWVRDIELTAEQEATLLAGNPALNGQLLGMRVWRERCRERRVAAQEHGRALARHWWLGRLSLPRTCLRRAVVNRPSSASKRRKGNVLPYGTGRLTVYSTDVIQSIYGAIQEYAGIERPDWLDL